MKPVVGVLLAAGFARRFGADKLCRPLADGTPIAVAAARALRPACERVVAVLRPEQQALAALLAAEGCGIVGDAACREGMGHSLAAGVRATPQAGGWLVALADMPFVAPDSHRRVAEALRAGADLAAPFHDGRRGHPVGFAARWYAALAALTGDAGARELIAGAAITRIEVDDAGVLRDVDTPKDLKA